MGEILSMSDPKKLPPVPNSARFLKNEFGDVYSTTDIDTATILKALNYLLVNVASEEGKRGRKVVFTFKGERIVQDLLEFLNDDLRLNPRDVLNRFREIKNISHEVQELQHVRRRSI